LYSGAILDDKKIPESILEHLLASEYGWSLEYISKLHPTKFQAHICICLVKQRIFGLQEQKEMAVAASNVVQGAI